MSLTVLLKFNSVSDLSSRVAGNLYVTGHFMIWCGLYLMTTTSRQAARSEAGMA